MGCDGGTIPKRDEMIRLKKKPEKIEKNFELNAKWFHCCLSQEPLRSPIVSCELGNFYNKESLLEYLLDKASATTDVAKHIRSLKDTKELQLSENATFEESSKKGESANGYKDFQASRYICPVVGIEMNGRYKFCFLWKCGCVFSERALKEVKSSVCHKCGDGFSEDDIVMINGGEEEVEKMRANMLQRRQKAKLEKKSKKIKMSSTDTSASAGASSTTSTSQVEQVFKHPGDTAVDVLPTKRQKLDSKPEMNGAAGTSKMTGTKSKGKQPKINMKMPELSKYKTVAEDPEASKVYKSLFTSGHDKRPDRLTSNWVTYHAYGGYHI